MDVYTPSCPSETAVPAFLGTRGEFNGRRSFHGPGWGGIWGMFKYTVFIVCFISKLLYIVIYNEIIIHLMECRISGSSKFVFLQPDSPIWG